MLAIKANDIQETRCLMQLEKPSNRNAHFSAINISESMKIINSEILGPDPSIHLLSIWMTRITIRGAEGR